MAAAEILQVFKDKSIQCQNLVGTAHQRTEVLGPFIFAEPDRKMITTAGFLNLFVAWEEFLEDSLAEFMIGGGTIGSHAPKRYVNPVDAASAKAMVVGPMRYFEYGNHDYFRKVVRLYFENGYPYEPHIGAIVSDLADMRTLRNSAAHISTTTQASLEGLAQRIFTIPMPGVDLYTVLTKIDPRDSVGSSTVFQTYTAKLAVTAELIVTGQTSCQTNTHQVKLRSAEMK